MMVGYAFPSVTSQTSVPSTRFDHVFNVFTRFMPAVPSSQTLLISEAGLVNQAVFCDLIVVIELSA